jgi:glycosyltransferase involved in cell wall biosynthesis
MTAPIRYSSQNSTIARPLAGVTGLPTVVVLGPFDDRAHAEQLAAAFAALRRRCSARLVLLGTGVQRPSVVQRTFARGVRPGVRVVSDSAACRWSDVVAAADVVMLSPASSLRTLLDVLAAGRPVVAPATAAIVRMVVPASAGLVYRPGDASGMAGALLRLLTTPALRHGMACRASGVARRHHLQRAVQQQFNRREQSCTAFLGE